MACGWDKVPANPHLRHYPTRNAKPDRKAYPRSALVLLGNLAARQTAPPPSHAMLPRSTKGVARRSSILAASQLGVVLPIRALNSPTARQAGAVAAANLKSQKATATYSYKTRTISIKILFLKNWLWKFLSLNKFNCTKNSQKRINPMILETTPHIQSRAIPTSRLLIGPWFIPH